MDLIPEQGSANALWTDRLRAWRATGQSQKAYCTAHDISYHQFTYWRRKLDGTVKPKRTAATRSGFVPVTKRRNPDASPGGLTIHLPNGVQIQGIEAQHTAWMKSLVDALA